jgi:DNA-binding response OmpR family regulator
MSDQDTQRLEGAKILIVDDDPDVLAVIDQAVRAEGASTKTCSDGNTAVHMIENDKPELVVLDMMLPKRSGFLVLERMKEIEHKPRVIMVTANEGKRHQAYAESLGVDGYLHKPVRLERLIQLAADCLGEEKKASE